MKIKLCAFSDEANPSLDGQIAALKRNNIPYMEMRGVDGKNATALTLEEAKAVKEKLDANGIQVWAIGSPLGKVDIHTDFNEYEKLVRHICMLANVLECKNIRIFSFFNAYEEREKVLTYLNQMAKIGAEYGVQMYHENEKGIYGDVAERVKDIMENTTGLQFVYDPANYLQCGETDADITLDALHAKTSYFHIKDVKVATGVTVPAGHGDGKISKLISLIDSDKTLTLEPHLRVFEGYSNIDNTEMKHEYTYESADEAFDASVAALKKLLNEAGYKEVDDAFIK